MADNNKNIPAHIGIIPDGNRRWSKERNLSNFDGHQRGYEKLKQTTDLLFSHGVKIVTFYTFSTENWNRARDEINYLMKLLRRAIDDEAERAIEKNFQILVSGRTDELPGDLPEACLDVMNKTKNGTAGILNLCLNYGGRNEIVDAIKKMIKNKIEPKQVHEGMIKKYLYNGQLPDPDIIIRTSGEKRLSGFQLWQSAYSEFVFLNKYWPDFEASDVDAILDDFAKRQRRFGGD